tara:strand:+ start:438 stop:1115 length:678 start_codon:yes stop_codon:yes gene_type:complete
MNIDAVILCGGKGTRFEAVSNSKAKALADIKGIPLIELIIQNLEKNGFSRFILAVGFRNEGIQDYFKGTQREIVFSKEVDPLGTGGAIKNSQKHINSEIFLVMNGDLICDMDYKKLIDAHKNSNKKATIAVSSSETSEDFGNIVLGNDNSIETFKEKVRDGSSNYVSAGTYIMDRDIFSVLPDKNAFSIETDFFEKNPEKLNAHIINMSFLDIGTPERYKEANKS